MAYEFKTNPYNHQKEALKRMLPTDAFALLMEMGSGKTKVAIDEIGILSDQGLIDRALILAPKGVYANWTEREIPAHMPDDLLSRTAMYRWDGLTKQTSKNLFARAVGWRGLAIMVMNIEAFSMSKKAMEAARTFIQSGTCVMYVDESTLIKNHQSKRTKNICKVGELAARRRIMTGSPVPRSPLDFFAQFHFLKPGLIGTKNYFAFRSRYAKMETRVFGGRSVQVVAGYFNLEDLTQRTQEHSYRVTKDECMDLPPKIYTRRDVELTPEQASAYQSMKEEAFAEVADGFASASAVITQIMRLHQISCGHVTNADGDVIDLPHRRTEALLEVADETQGKMIVWARYRRDIANICAALRAEYGDASVVEYHGGTKGQDRETAVTRFQDDPSCRFFVANQQTGGYGITLTAASTVVYYSNDYDLEKRLQSEDRAHRSGQTKSVLYVDLAAPNTVDIKILEALRSKKSLADLVTGDDVRDWFE
jgi:SNF2 family DNA or RNA helicase